MDKNIKKPKFLDFLKKRQSIRKFSNKPVERDKIERCLEAARLAPSASNSQPWFYIVIDDPKLREKIAKETFGAFVSFNSFSLQAPVLIVVITENSNFKAKIGGMIKNKKYNHTDIGFSMSYLCLQAVEEDLGTCVLGWFDESGIKKILDIPKKLTIDFIITIGYPDSNEIRPKIRKPIKEIRAYNSYKFDA